MTELPRVIPALLLDGERFVKTTRFASPDYVGDPVNVLSLFNAFEVDEIVLLDIGAARSRRPADLGLLRHLAEECFIPMAYGGGVEDLDRIEAVLSAGYEKVVLNTVLADRMGLLDEAARSVGSQALVASIDVVGGVDGTCRVRGASTDTGIGPVAWARRVEDAGAGEILLTSVDREGTMSGFDLHLVEAVAGAVGIPVIAHGGAAKRSQLGEPLARGASAVAAGSLFVYQGTQRGVLVNYPTRTQLERLLAPRVTEEISS